MAENIDGGSAALAGFLYQILGTWGFVAVKHITSPINQILSSLIAVKHEAHGQDAVLLGLDFKNVSKTVLVQFKYSSNPHSEIAPQELFEIATAFKVSSKTFFNNEELSYVLTSNRQLSKNAQNLVKAAKMRKSHALLGNVPQKKQRPMPKPAERHILANLRYINFGLPSLIQTLQNRCSQLGVLNSEVNRGINNIIGQLINTPPISGHKKLTPAELDNSLVGELRARSLTRNDRAIEMRANVREFIKETNCRKPLLPRGVNELINAQTLGVALVLLHGPGGCGKSACLGSFLENLVLASPPLRYVAVTQASNVNSAWITKTVAIWRGGLPDTQVEVALERLEVAHNSSVRPVIILAVDGLDEACHRNSYNQSYICELLTFVKQEFNNADAVNPLRIVLIATCRSPADLDNIWPHHGEDFEIKNTSSSGSPSAGLTLVSLDEFTLDELAEIAKTLDTTIANRIREGTGAQSIILGASVPNVPHQEIIDSLRQPVFWRFFAELDVVHQNLVLDLNSVALNGLCAKYIDWFFRKLSQRYLETPTDITDMKDVLFSIAAQYNPSDKIGNFSLDWETPALSCKRININQIRKLYSEGLSFGLINNVDKKGWRWRHPCVCRFLADAPLSTMEEP